MGRQRFSLPIGTGLVPYHHEVDSFSRETVFRSTHRQSAESAKAIVAGHPDGNGITADGHRETKAGIGRTVASGRLIDMED
jgi:hypothetical protein